MKRFLILLVYIAGLLQVVQAQLKTTPVLQSPARTIKKEKASAPSVSVIGHWKSYFVYSPYSSSQNYYMRFEPNGKLTVIGFSGVEMGKGEYSLSNNQVKGNVSLNLSPVVQYSFVADYSGDRFTGSFGNNGSATGLGELTLVSVPASAVPVYNGVPDPNHPTCRSTNFNEYYLVAATAKIYTGNDNKESPSISTIYLSVRGPSGGAVFSSYQDQNKSEYRVNSVTEVPLTALYWSCMNYRPDYYADKVALSLINTHGLQLQVSYSPNFFTDAWKVDKVELLVQFKKSDGTAHPQFGNKLITFQNSSILLNNTTKSLTLNMDRFLMPQ